MKNFHRLVNNPPIYFLAILAGVISVCFVMTPLSKARVGSVTISVVNNSGKEIRHVFLASAGSDNWGDDQLSESITAGTSRNITADWNESTVKVVGEDEDGCFLTTTLDTAGTPSWTITNSTPRNCGS